MKFSYRHPDISAKESERPKLSALESGALVERCKFVRLIPIPAGIDGADEEMWRLWDKAELDNNTKK